MTEAMTFASVFMQLIALVCAGVWAVSTIKSTTNELTSTIRHLEATVAKLAVTIDSIETKAVDHEVRISILERNNDTKHL